jgi:ABC-type multidrug transport system ATPase subunit
VAISAHDLVIGYQSPLREPLSLRVEAGHTLAVIGPNGSGKTTLFHTLLGIIPALGGSFEMQDPLGALFQDRALPLNIPVHRWISHIAQLWQVPVNHSLLEQLGIEHSTSPIRRLSGGQAQKLAIYSAMAHEPKTLILDEPTNNLDAQSRTAVYAAITSLRNSGSSILLSSHQAQDVAALDSTILNFNLSHSEGPSALVTFSGALAVIPQELTVQETATGFIVSTMHHNELLAQATLLANVNNVSILSFQVIS